MGLWPLRKRGAALTIPPPAAPVAGTEALADHAKAPLPGGSAPEPGSSASGPLVATSAAAESTTAAPAAAAPEPPPTGITTGPLSEADLLGRRQGDPGEQTFRIAQGMVLRYAHISQRGYYPSDPFSPNQDRFLALPQLYEPGMILLAVFDGHGPDGHDCSNYARQALPPEMLKLWKVKDAVGAATAKTQAGLLKGVREAFLNVNSLMHMHESFDDDDSGTTAITALIRASDAGPVLHIANVGDSRAIVAKRRGKEVVAYPLSIDQTPHRRDERVRLRKGGAFISSIRMMDAGEPPVPEPDDPNDDPWAKAVDDLEADPPRVFHPRDNGGVGGCAFTRSIGDEQNEPWGVTAEPEFLSMPLTAEDQFFVLASDGVWTFMTNQEVADTVMLSNGDPCAACRDIVANAYSLWLQFDSRTDDITVVVAFVDDEDLGPAPRAPTQEEESMSAREWPAPLDSCQVDASIVEMASRGARGRGGYALPSAYGASAAFDDDVRAALRERGAEAAKRYDASGAPLLRYGGGNSASTAASKSDGDYRFTVPEESARRLLQRLGHGHAARSRLRQEQRAAREIQAVSRKRLVSSDAPAGGGDGQDAPIDEGNLEGKDGKTSDPRSMKDRSVKDIIDRDRVISLSEIGMEPEWMRAMREAKTGKTEVVASPPASSMSISKAASIAPKQSLGSTGGDGQPNPSTPSADASSGNAPEANWTSTVLNPFSDAVQSFFNTPMHANATNNASPNTSQRGGRAYLEQPSTSPSPQTLAGSALLAVSSLFGGAGSRPEPGDAAARGSFDVLSA